LLLIAVLVFLTVLADSPFEFNRKSWVSINEHHQDLVIDPEIEKLVTSRFDTLCNLLNVEPTDKELTLPYGIVKHRIGTMRLSIVKFFAHIASLRSPSFIDEMIRSGALRQVLVSVPHSL